MQSWELKKGIIRSLESKKGKLNFFIFTRVIKDENGRVLVKEREVINKWET